VEYTSRPALKRLSVCTVLGKGRLYYWRSFDL